ncbi:MAG: bifunctional folylpolyglutamate synthase/dihydrofolate synthase [Alphaproteobacteria bacterium]|nr:bifunctional folylpolyglutamate synthase/dihydrofolate synthase [Alphaproteobacteria bacterium]
MYASDLTHDSAALESKLRHLYSLNREKQIDLGFRPPYLALLEAFGNPHRKLPPLIHIAGTNGKGSITAMIRAVLEAAGYKVHAYTSPHLVAFNERIVLAGEPITDGPLETLIDEALALNAGQDVTFFEVTTAMALAAFSRVTADICLLETGLGGRLDCTNIVEQPLVTIINAIGYDHMEYLGETLPLIAAEKAGIMKQNVPCVIGTQTPEALAAGVMAVFETRAAETGSVLYRSGQEWSVRAEDKAARMNFTFGTDRLTLPPPALTGVHQIENAGAALAALCLLEKQFPGVMDAAAQGLKQVTWRARLQDLTTLAQGTAFEVPPGWTLYLDGGHNADAGAALAAQAKLWALQDGKPLHLVTAMMNHKDPRGFLGPLLPRLESLTLTTIPGEPNAMSAQALKAFLPAGFPIRDTESAQNAVRAIAASDATPGRILIAGSLYLAGDILKHLPGRGHNKV